MYILDSDTLTYLHAGHHRVIERLRSVDDPAVVTTVINKIELLHGHFDFVLKAETGADLIRAQQLLTRTDELLAQLLVLPFDDLAVTHFDRLRLQSSLRKIGRADLLIASITLARRATLVTRNQRHFRQIPGLQVENWVD
jgi:tRNA(fMet)-specific endonuclease VapC